MGAPPPPPRGVFMPVTGMGPVIASALRPNQGPRRSIWSMQVSSAARGCAADRYTEDAQHLEAGKRPQIWRVARPYCNRPVNAPTENPQIP